MRKFLSFIVCLFVVMSVSTVADAQTKMTDKQVLEYVKKATKAGKNQKTITQELALRGVDRAQAARVKKLMEEAGFKDVKVVQDYAHLDRVVWGRI